MVALLDFDLPNCTCWSSFRGCHDICYHATFAIRDIAICFIYHPRYLLSTTFAIYILYHSHTLPPILYSKCCLKQMCHGYKIHGYPISRRVNVGDRKYRRCVVNVVDITDSKCLAAYSGTWLARKFQHVPRIFWLVAHIWIISYSIAQKFPHAL